jgi:dihydrodipicolinate reductase
MNLDRAPTSSIRNDELPLTGWDSRITVDVYTQAVNSNKRAAQSKVVRMMMVSDVGQKAEENTRKQGSSGLIGPLSDPELTVTVGRHSILSALECVAGTTGLEPATSAVTEHQKFVTNCKQGATAGTFGALRNGEKPLLHPY